MLVKGSVGEDGKARRGFSAAGTIRLDGATIGGHVTAAAATLTDPANLEKFRVVESGRCALIFDGARIAGDVIAGDAFRAYGEVRGVGATIGGQLDLTGAQITNAPTKHDPRGAALTLDYARITTDVFAEKGFSANGTVSATGATIGGNLKITGARVTNPPTSDQPNRHAIVLADAQITLSVFAGVKTEGAVCATGVLIGGQLSLGGAVLTRPAEGGVLILDGAKIGGDLSASADRDSVGATLSALNARGEVCALRVSIGGDLNLHGAELKNPDGDALTLDNAQIGRHVFAGGGFTAHGTVRALGINIGRDLYLNGAELTKHTTVDGVDRCALLLDDANISGSVSAGLEMDGQKIHGFRANGGVFARGITIGRDLDLNGAIFNCPPTSANPNQYALLLDDAQINGDFFAGTVEDPSGTVLEDPPGTVLGAFRADGEVRAHGASVGGDLNLEGAHLTNKATGTDPLRYALDISGAHVNGSVLGGIGETGDSEPCNIEGAIRANDVVVGLRLDFSGAKLDNSHGCALDLESATVSRLLLTPAVCIGGVSLVRAQVNDLDADSGEGEQYRAPPKPLKAIGWHIDDLHGPLRQHWKRARDWLETAPVDANASDPPTRFARYTAWLRRSAPVAVQPWYALADVYDRNGDPAGARHLRFAADKKVTAQSPLLTRMVRRVYQVVAGNGHYPLLSIVSMMFPVGIAWGLVYVDRADIVPTDRAAAEKALVHPTTPPTPITARTPCGEYPDYPCMQPLTFAINAVLPPAAGTNANWTIASSSAPWLVIGLTAIKLALWALAALFLAGVTGLLRKTKT